MVDYTPEKRDIVWINFNPAKGHEQKGRRPALVVSNNNYNKKTGLFLACPITKNKKGYPFEVELGEGKINGVVLSDQVKCLDWQKREVTFIKKAKESTFNKVKENISLLIS